MGQRIRRPAGVPAAARSPRALRRLGAGSDARLFPGGEGCERAGMAEDQGAGLLRLLETTFGVGSSIEPTVDIFGGLGSVILMHQDAEVLQRDVAQVREMEFACELFEVEPEVRHNLAVGVRK